MEQITMCFTGVRPLLMHNGAMVDPRNPHVQEIKKITSKGSKKQTESDLEKLSRLEWEAGLYWDDQAGPFIPSDNIERCIQLGASRKRKGKDVMCGVYVIDEIVKLEFSGSRDKDKLYANAQHMLRKGISVNRGMRTIRCRPKFPQWSITFTLEYDEQIMNRKDLIQAADDAGIYVGLGDWRPKYGRFEVEVL